MVSVLFMASPQDIESLPAQPHLLPLRWRLQVFWQQIKLLGDDADFGVIRAFLVERQFISAFAQ